MGGTGKSFAGVVALRGIALGGRFVFVIFAAKNMAADEFGRFGLLQALALIVSAAVGLEAYQVLLRKIQNADAPQAAELRHAYGLFAGVASIVAALVALIALLAMGWSGAALALGVAVVAGEHLVLEAYRNLVNEGRPTLAIFNVALRTGAWGIVIPALDIIGLIPRPWSLELVLWFWLGGLACGLAASAGLWRAFLPRFGGYSRANLSSIAGEVAALSRAWIISVLAWRVVENGGRFVAAWMISEAAAGRFALLGMLTSIGFIAQKSVIEPVLFPRLVKQAGDDGDRLFAQLSVLSILVGVVAAGVGWAIVLWSTGARPSQDEAIVFVALLLTASAFTLSQLPHFKLYRLHRDQDIRNATLAGAAVMIVSSVVLGRLWNLPGVAIGTALGALAMLATKWSSAAKSARHMAAGETS